MANIKSQIKRNRQNEMRRRRNRSVRSFIKTRTRRFHEAVAAEDPAAASAAFDALQKALDQAAAKGVIHRNKASNRKARLARRLHDLSG